MKYDTNLNEDIACLLCVLSILVMFVGKVAIEGAYFGTKVQILIWGLRGLRLL